MTHEPQNEGNCWLWLSQSDSLRVLAALDRNKFSDRRPFMIGTEMINRQQPDNLHYHSLLSQQTEHSSNMRASLINAPIYQPLSSNKRCFIELLWHETADSKPVWCKGLKAVLYSHQWITVLTATLTWRWTTLLTVHEYGWFQIVNAPQVSSSWYTTAV